MIGAGMSKSYLLKFNYIGKDKTQQLERTNGIIRQQTRRWHRRQNKFGKVRGTNKDNYSISSKLLQLHWQHSRFKTTAAQQARLTTRGWLR